MRKRIIDHERPDVVAVDQEWLDLQSMAQVELTSEDAANPIEAAAREQAWTGTALALVANLGVGSVTAATIQMGFALAGLFAALGATIILTGGGLVWAVRAPATEKAPAFRTAPIPA